TRRLVIVGAALLIQGCSGDGSPTSLNDTQYTISDGAHGGSVSGFYFLPPMVPQPAFDGVFEADVDPTVEICELDDSGLLCAGAQPVGFPLVFGRTTGEGAERVRVESHHYILNWHTKDFPLDPDRFYRISVVLGGRVLGFADVDVAESGKALKNVDTDEYIALKDGRTLPIKFRIEQSAPVAASDAYSVLRGSNLAAPSPGVLANDERGVPGATVTSFGGGSLGGSAADQTAGTSVPLAGGTLTLGADGGLVLAEPAEAGVWTFSYPIVAEIRTR